MWGNLTKSLGEAASSASAGKSPSKLIARLGEVVAPPADDDEDEEYDDDEEEEYESGSGSEYDDYEEEDEEGGNKLGFFGLARGVGGVIASAAAVAAPDADYDDYDDEDDNGQDEIDMNDGQEEELDLGGDNVVTSRSMWEEEEEEVTKMNEFGSQLAPPKPMLPAVSRQPVIETNDKANDDSNVLIDDGNDDDAVHNVPLDGEEEAAMTTGAWEEEDKLSFPSNEFSSESTIAKKIAGEPTLSSSLFDEQEQFIAKNDDNSEINSKAKELPSDLIPPKVNDSKKQQVSKSNDDVLKELSSEPPVQQNNSLEQAILLDSAKRVLESDDSLEDGEKNVNIEDDKNIVNDKVVEMDEQIKSEEEDKETNLKEHLSQPAPPKTSLEPTQPALLPASQDEDSESYGRVDNIHSGDIADEKSAGANKEVKNEINDGFEEAEMNTEVENEEVHNYDAVGTNKMEDVKRDINDNKVVAEVEIQEDPKNDEPEGYNDDDDDAIIVEHQHAPSTALFTEPTEPRSSNQPLETNDKLRDVELQLQQECQQLRKQLSSTQEQYDTLQQQQTHEQHEQLNIQKQLQINCDKLQKDLISAKSHIKNLTQKVAEQDHQQKIQKELLSQQRQDDQARLMASAEKSAAEALERETLAIRTSMEQQCQFLETQLQQQQEESSLKEQELRRLLVEANETASALRLQHDTAIVNQEEHALQQQQQFQQEITASQEAAMRAQAILHDKENEVTQLHTVIKDLRAVIAKNQEGAEEAEEEMDDLHAENEELHKKIEEMESEKINLEKKFNAMQKDQVKLEGMQMELHMLQEARERDRVTNEQKTHSANTDLSNLTSERDQARAEVVDLQSRLTAALADLDIARADADRATTASSNLQMALEAFQSEREAELALLEEQRVKSEEVEREKNRVAMEANTQENERIMKEVQMAADKAVRNSMDEIDRMEATVQQLRKDNTNLRRSLDEAIHRLQTSQDDVVDRALMKNILLDWHSKSGKARRDVMVLMASVLHFTEDEKDKVGIGEGPGTIGKVVGAVTAPIPPPALNVDKIEGDSVREKWVNFLMAESGGASEEGASAATETKTMASTTPTAANNANQSVS